MQKILLIKTSSLGDVIHNLPVASDIRRALPHAEIHWVVEENFAAIPALHPAVTQVIPVAIRRWRRDWFGATARAERQSFRRHLQRQHYDGVLDTQGLLKSALIARAANGRRCGYAWGSAREPLASLFYQDVHTVEKNLHAVERNRLLAAKCLGYESAQAVEYSIRAPALALDGLPTISRPGQSRYAVLLHATSRADKLWGEADWIALGRQLNAAGIACVLPWGSAEENARSIRLAKQMPDAVVPPRLSLDAAAALLAGAVAVAGVDTGLSHLAAALRVPVVGIYCATAPGLTGIYPAVGARAMNLGEAGRPPAVAEVLAAIECVMR